jgi:hypothetical protein
MGEFSIGNIITIVVYLVSIGVLYGALRTEVKAICRRLDKLEGDQKIMMDMVSRTSKMEIKLEYHDEKFAEQTDRIKALEDRICH